MGIEPWVVTALISVAGGVVTAVSVAHTLNKDRDAKEDATATHLANIDTKLAVLTSKVDELSGRVDKHNGVIERVYKLESDEATMWRRHDELKDELKHLRAGGTDD